MNFIKFIAQISISPDELEIPQTGDPSTTTVSNVLSLVFGVLGGIALIIIVYAGIQFILSRGEPQKAATARNTIIYAGVGLAIAVSAFTIVRFTVSIL